MMRWLLITGISIFSINSFADTQCGPYRIYWGSKDGFARINDIRPESQKITFQKKHNDYGNVKIQWMVLDKETGRWIGMDFIAIDDNPILNIEFIQINTDEPRVFSTYDCARAK